MLAKQSITFEAGDDLVTYLMEQGYDLQFGARPLKRLIQKKLMDELSLAMLKGTVEPGMHIRMGVENGQVVFAAD